MSTSANPFYQGSDTFFGTRGREYSARTRHDREYSIVQMLPYGSADEFRVKSNCVLKHDNKTTGNDTFTSTRVATYDGPSPYDSTTAVVLPEGGRTGSGHYAFLSLAKAQRERQREAASLLRDPNVNRGAAASWEGMSSDEESDEELVRYEDLETDEDLDFCVVEA